MNRIYGRAVALCAMIGAIGAGASALAEEWPQLPELLNQKVIEAADACRSFENGTLALEWHAVRRVDLDGDRRPDWVLNEAGFACSSAASLFCGTGGCLSHFLIGDNRQAQLNRGWDVVTLGVDRVVLADVHGSRCDGINPTPCVTASVWDAENKTWRSNAASWE